MKRALVLFCGVVLVVSVVTVGQRTAKLARRGKMVEIPVPRSLQAATRSETKTGMANLRGLGAVQVKVTGKNRTISKVQIDGRVFKAQGGHLDVSDLVASGGGTKGPLSDCIDKEGCADKPTNGGVATCVMNCTLKVLEDLWEDEAPKSLKIKN